ncbi:tetratricopeptide repeat protein, partial [Chryseobacterium sp. SIMBA_028]|uniref:tetratricopeptide repeat protein n=1 Tax=Chryseobacterium sp. SIMBA_028 TaxID=3085771 RepID=UPI00397C715B
MERWQPLAADGNAEAQFSLANMYGNGIGVAQDYKKAYELYEKAADQGYATAQYVLAYMFYHGIGVEQNEAEAFKWASR